MADESFLERLKNSKHPVVIDAWAPWCLPCRAIEPALSRLTQEYQEKVALWRVNADEDAGLARLLGVDAIPTLVAFAGGSEIARRTGFQSYAALKELFETATASTVPTRSGLHPYNRALRAAAGLSLLIVGIVDGRSVFLITVAGLLLFSAVYDRCPLWRALVPRLSEVLRRNHG